VNKKFDYYNNYLGQIVLDSRDEDASISNISFINEVNLKIREWIFNRKGILTLSGDPGVGKTYLIKAIINDCIHDVYSCRYMHINTFFNHLRDTISENWDPIREIDRICETAWWIMDDFGANTKMTEWQVDMFFEFVQKRHESMKPTLITTNLSEKEISSISPRTASRLKSHDNYFINVIGEDKRLGGIK